MSAKRLCGGMGLCLWVASCGAEERIFLELPSVEGPAIVLTLVLNEQEKVVRQETPIRMDASASALPKLELQPDELSVVVLAIPEREIRDANVVYDAARFEEIAFVPESIGQCEKKISEGEQRTVELVMPPGIQAWRYARGDPPSLNALSLDARPTLRAGHLSTPSEPELCSGMSGRQFETWSPVEFALNDTRFDTRSERYPRDHWRVDEERALFVTSPALVLLDRTRGFVDDAVHVFEAPGHIFTRLAVVEQPVNPSDGMPLTVIGEVPDTGESALFDFVINSAGLEHVGTTTIAAYLIAVAVDERGTLVAVSPDAIFSRPPGGQVSMLAHQGPPIEHVHYVPALGQTRGFFAISVKDGIVLTSDGLSQWRPLAEEDPGKLGVTYRGMTAFGDADGRELWVAGTSGVLARLRPNGAQFEDRPVEYPPLFAECAGARPISADCGGLHNGESYLDLTAVERGDPSRDRIFATTRGCQAVIELRRDAPCAWVHRIGDLPLPEGVDGRRSDQVRVFRDRVSIAVEGGALYELDASIE